jgi:hypothetical protein
MPEGRKLPRAHAVDEPGKVVALPGAHKRPGNNLPLPLSSLQEPRSAFGMLNLDLLAVAVSMRGDHERAARLFGTAPAAREAAGISVMS